MADDSASILGDDCPHCGDTYHDLPGHYALNYKGCAAVAGLSERLGALDGKWDLVTDCETAGVLSAAIPEADRERLPVRSHPWLPAGEIIAMQPGSFEARGDIYRV
jgi:hypothetical protein